MIVPSLTRLPGGAESGSTQRRVGAELDPERVAVRPVDRRRAVAAVARHVVGVLARSVSQLTNAIVQRQKYFSLEACFSSPTRI